MIKRLDAEHLDEVMRIWLAMNKSAHSFVPAKIWSDAYDGVKVALPAADGFVWQENQKIKGFIGITDGGYLAGLFVDEKHQAKGIGSELLNHCQQRYSRLELDVFVENKAAVCFYEKNGFSIVESKMNPYFLFEEFHMCWQEKMV